MKSKIFCALTLAVATLPSARALTPADAPPADPNVYVELSRKIMPSVVNISAMTNAKLGPHHLTPEEMFRHFFEGGGYGGMPRKMPKTGALGTGFVIDSSGIILTNNHVVAGADEIRITFTESPEEKPVEGKVIGRDPELDVALIRVSAKHELKALALGDSEKLQVGEYVAAVGNPFGQGHSITHGIISAKGRHIPDLPYATYLQTDAPINPGNSGGPLVNLKGEVIGINNAIDARAQGIGFAIPVNAVKGILDQLKSKGMVARGYLGLTVGELNPNLAEHLGFPRDFRAPLVNDVLPKSPAAHAKLKPYDVITRFNGKEVRSGAELVNAVREAPIGSKVKVTVSRGGKELTLQIPIAARPQQKALEG